MLRLTTLPLNHCAVPAWPGGLPGRGPIDLPLGVPVAASAAAVAHLRKLSA